MGNEERSETRESRLLAEHPGLREEVESIPEFVEWLGSHRAVDIDGETLYVIGGDQLKDHDQIVVEWVRRFRPDLLGGEPRYGDESD